MRGRCAFGVISRVRGLLHAFNARIEGDSIVGQIVHHIVIRGKLRAWALDVLVCGALTLVQALALDPSSPPFPYCRRSPTNSQFRLQQCHRALTWYDPF